MKKKAPKAPSVVNRRARYDYELGDELVVGLSLNGREVRAARLGHIQLKGSYVAVDKDQLWLTKASFSVVNNVSGSTNARTVDDTPRRLLAHRKEIDALHAARKDGRTIVPLKLLTGGRYIKLVIALGKGKKLYDKRQTIKRRDQDRESRR
ncbi:MAG TPA: SsrA-binding protein SmpB [Candidatus Saccharimonadales bacterium]|jgi:SsrA-binding protein